MSKLSTNLLSNTVQKPLSTRLSIGLAVIGLLIILVMVNLNIKTFETHLNTGKPVLLELAPVDPRGLMQGDYMALHFALADDIDEALTTAKDQSNIPNGDGIVIVTLDDNQVAHFTRLASFKSQDSNFNSFDKSTNSLATDEMALYFRVRNGDVKFATNAFFFQEGHAEAYEAAKYGLFRVNDKGNPLLTNMVNSEFKLIEGSTVEGSGN